MGEWPVVHRRAYLAGMASAMAVPIAGCLDEPRREYLARPLEYDLVQAGRSPEPLETLRWYTHVDGIRAQFESHVGLDEEAEAAVTAFLDSTDSDTEDILMLAAGGPTQGHTAIEMEYLSWTDEEIIGSASVVETGNNGSEPVYPIAFVRLEVSEELPDVARIELTDGYGETRLFSVHRNTPHHPGDLQPEDLPGN